MQILGFMRWRSRSEKENYAVNDQALRQGIPDTAKPKIIDNMLVSNLN